MVSNAAAEFGQDDALLLRVGVCESHLRPEARNAESGATGIYQWLPYVWNANRHLLSYEAEDIWNPTAQARLTANALGRGEHWKWAASEGCWK